MRLAVCGWLICLAPFWSAADKGASAMPEQAVAFVPWGRPLVGGPIRALFIAPRFTLRDATELARRLDITYDVAPVWDAHHLGSDLALPSDAVPGTSAEETAARLRELLGKQHDLIVIGNVDLSMFPEDILATVQQQVADGAGLLLAHHRTGLPESFRTFLDGLVPVEDLTPITAGIGEALTPEWFGGLDFVRASPYGNGRAEALRARGRVIELNYPGARPRTHCLLPTLSQPLLARPEFLDVYFSLVAKAARWAAGREPAVRIVKVEYVGPSGPDEAEIPPDLPKEFVQVMRDAVVRQPYRPYRVTLSAPAARDLRVSAQVRESERPLKLFFPYEELLLKGRDSYPLLLPIGPGRYFLDVWLRDHDKVADWYTEVVTIEGWPEFSGVTFSKSALLPNDTLDISLNVRPLFHQPRPCVAYARATDPLARLVSEQYQTVSAVGGAVRITLGFADLITGMVKIDLFVADSPEPPLGYLDLQYAAHYAAYLAVRRTAPPDAFRFIVDGGGTPEYNELATLHTLVRLGVDMVHVPAVPAWRQALCGLDLLPLPELTRYDCDAARDGAVRVPCPSDSAFRAEEAARLQEGTVLFWAGGSAMYSLGGGNRLADTEENVRQSTLCLQDFRQVLQVRYKTLDALNAAWEADFGDWDAVRPYSQEEAGTSARFAGWVEFRRYMDDAFSGIHAYARDIVRGIDRSGRVGCRVLPGSPVYRGYDWHRLASELDVLAAQPDHLTVEKLRSYRTPRSCTGVSVGDTCAPQTVEQARWLPWYLVFHQMSLLWWRDAIGDSELAAPRVALDSDGRPNTTFGETAQAVRAIRDAGLDALLSRAVRACSRIAIYAGRPSELVSVVEPSFGGDSLLAEAAFARVLERLGYQYDFLAPEMVIRGQVREYDLLILPMARALSDAETVAIREFHARGGRLIADIAPGQFDERGVPRPQLPLDELFGVSHDGAPQAGAPVEGRIAWPSEEATPRFTDGFPSVVTDTSLRATSGRAGGAADDTPIWLTTGDTQWATLLINHAVAFPPTPVQDIFHLDQNPASDEKLLQGLLGAALDQMGMLPIVPLSLSKDGASDVECVAFRYDKAEVVALLRCPGEGGKKRTVLLHFDPDRYVYDPGVAARIRRSQKVGAALRPGEAKLFSALPYEVTEVRISVPESTVAGSRLPVRVLIKTQDALPGEHLVHIEVVPGSGAPQAHYAQNLVCRAGEGETFVPLALDEAPGFYTVKARDVLTGLTSATAVRVLPRSGRLLP